MIWIPIIATFGACSLAFQLLCGSALASVTGWALWSQVAVSTVFLASLGMGSLLAGKIRDRDVARALFRAELGLTALGSASTLLVLGVYCLVKVYAHDVDADEFLATEQSKAHVAWIALAVPLGLGMAAGFELPLLLRLATWRPGKLFAANYVGTLVGSLVLVYGLQPRLDLVSAATCLGLVNWIATAGLLILLRLRGADRATLGRRQSLELAACGVFIAGLAFAAPSLQELYLQIKYSRGARALSLRDTRKFLQRAILERVSVERLRSSYQDLDFVTRAGQRDPEFYLDGHIQLHPSWEAAYHESLVHLPIQFFKAPPRRVLVLGGGDGMVVREVLKYGARIEHVTLVELDPMIIHLAREWSFFRKLNQSSLFDPRVEVKVEDALTFLRHREPRSPGYDAVYLDFPLPYDFDLLKLYSVELYRLAARNLAPGGFIALDAAILSARGRTRPPSVLANAERWNRILSSSLQAAGFKQVVPYEGSEGFVTARLSATTQPSESLTDYGFRMRVVDPQFIRQALQVPALPAPDSAFVNSIFRPQLHSLQDFQF